MFPDYIKVNINVESHNTKRDQSVFSATSVPALSRYHLVIFPEYAKVNNNAVYFFTKRYQPIFFSTSIWSLTALVVFHTVIERGTLYCSRQVYNQQNS